MIRKIRKRDGKFADFNPIKITNAVWKAAQAVGGKDRKTSESITDKVVEYLEKHVPKGEFPTVEQVQDTVEKMLIEGGHARTGKAYILYRKQHKDLREVGGLLQDIDVVDGYLSMRDWKVKENSNMSYSLQGLNVYATENIVSHYWLSKIYPPEIGNMHVNGDFHIHDLGTLGAYCVGWDLKDILLSGFRGVKGKIESKPAKHFGVALMQVVNFLYTLQGEAAGAQALSNFDTLLAPFVRHDNLDHKDVRQEMQKFLYNMNVPTRVGFQSLPWNETIVIEHGGNIESVEIGELIDRESEKHKHRIVENGNGSSAIKNHDDYQVLAFNKNGDTEWVNVKAFIRHRVPQNSSFINLRTSRGNARISPGHSMFRSKDLKSFDPEPIKADNIETSHPNGKLSKNNHVIAIANAPRIGGEKKIDVAELIDELPQVRKKVFVQINSKQIDDIKERVEKEYDGLTEFYLEYGFSNGRRIWRDFKRHQRVRFDVWRRFGGNNADVNFFFKNSKEKTLRYLKGNRLKAFIKLTAWYLSEGHNAPSVGMFVSQGEKGAGKIKKILSDLNISFSEEKNHGYSKKGNESPILKIRCNGLLSWLISFHGGTYSTNKHIPSFLYKISEDFQEAFVDELMKGDASESKNYFDFITTSKKLSLGLSTLLAMLKKDFSVYEYKARKDEWSDQYQIRIYKKEKPKKKQLCMCEARLCSSINKFTYDKGYEYDISVDTEVENFAGGSGLLAFHNSPFTNVTMDLTVPDYSKNEPVIIGGEVKEDTYADFSQEMDMINRAFAEVMQDGDAKGRPFTFPIPTYNITKDFDWEKEGLEPVWEMTAKYGVPYFSNFVNSDMSPDDARSMCCRLRLDNRELKKRGGGLFGSNPKTGSIGVVTINLPRIGYLSRDENEFFERLDRLMVLAKESLETKREMIEGLTSSGLHPYSQFYLSDIKKGFGEYWKNHFSTIGLIGLNDALLNFMNTDIGSKDGLEFAKKVFDYMRKRLSDFQQETGNIFNLEATPAEGTSYRLARIDKKEYPDIRVYNQEKDSNNGEKEEPYYTNSSQLPVGYTDDVFEALDLQDPLQTKYTGGTVLHIFLGEESPSPEAVKKFVRTVAENYSLPYYTITPTFSICPVHGYMSGKHFHCPICEEEGKNTACEVYSRVVGYLRPVEQWNAGKQQEFNDRKTFDSIKGNVKP